MSYQEFTNKYSCKTNFLQYYQVISAIPKHLLAKAKSTKPINKELYSDSNLSLQLNECLFVLLCEGRGGGRGGGDGGKKGRNGVCES